MNNDLQNTTQKTEDWTTNEIHNFIHFFLLFISFYKTKTYSTVVIKIWWIDVSLNYKVLDNDSTLFTTTVHCIHASSTYILYIQGYRFIQQLWWYSISVVVLFFLHIIRFFSLVFTMYYFMFSILYLRVDS